MKLKINAGTTKQSKLFHMESKRFSKESNVFKFDILVSYDYLELKKNSANLINSTSALQW